MFVVSHNCIVSLNLIEGANYISFDFEYFKVPEKKSG